MDATAILDAVLPAGGRLDSELAKIAGTDVKTLLTFGGTSILENVLQALGATGRIRRMFVVGPESVRSIAENCGATFVAEGSTGPENFYRGVDAVLSQPDPPQKIVFSTSDLPFVTADHINQFLDMCPDTDMCVPLVTETAFHRRFPGCPSTFVRLGGIDYTLAGIFLIDGAAFMRSRQYIEAVFSQRKSKLGLAKLLGFSFLVRFVLKTLRLEDVEVQCRSMLKCEGLAIPGVAAEFAYDIDDKADYDDAVQRFDELSKSR